MYQKSELTVQSKCDALPLSVLMLLPGQEEECKGVVQLVHGMSEYKERYLPLMEYLAQHGYVSVIHDHRGHGQSVRSKQDLGYMYEVGMEGLISDVLQINEFVHEKFPNHPVYMFGHSMGSLAARVFLREHDDCIDKLILSGPPSRNKLVDCGILLAKFQKMFKGGHSAGKMLEKISVGAYGKANAKAFPNELTISSWICSDPEVVKAYEESHLCGFTFTADGFLTLFQLLKYTYKEKGWKCTKQELPILYLGGCDDACIGGADKFQDEIMVLKHAGYNYVDGKMYPGMRHEICNEKGKEEVFADIVKFLE